MVLFDTIQNVMVAMTTTAGTTEAVKILIASTWPTSSAFLVEPAKLGGLTLNSHNGWRAAGFDRAFLQLTGIHDEGHTCT